MGSFPASTLCCGSELLQHRVQVSFMANFFGFQQRAMHAYPEVYCGRASRSSTSLKLEPLICSLPRWVPDSRNALRMDVRCCNLRIYLVVHPLYSANELPNDARFAQPCRLQISTIAEIVPSALSAPADSLTPSFEKTAWAEHNNASCRQLCSFPVPYISCAIEKWERRLYR